MTRIPLLPAEFYYLHDRRDDSQLLLSQKQYDPDPGATAAIAGEIAARMLARDPTWTSGKICDAYYELPDAEIGPDLVPRASAFKKRTPAALPHYDMIFDFTDGQNRFYRVVSSAWKDAIESVEPGLHQFFPHELHFTDGIVSDRFILREGRRIETGAPYFNADPIEDQFDRIIGYRLVWEGEAIHVTLDRQRVEWRDWVREPRGQRIFVSPALAEELHKLLPDFTALVPVALSGGTLSPTRRPAPINPFSGFDATIIKSLKTVLQPFSWEDQIARHNATIALQARLASGTAAEAFRLMEASFALEGPLSKNQAFQFGWMACNELPERDVLECARAWANDPDPRKRIAAVRALSRLLYRNEKPTPATFAALTAMLDDPDPLVLEKAIGIIASTGHPLCMDALRARKDRLQHHPDNAVREAYPFADANDDPDDEEKDLRARLEGASAASVIETACERLRSVGREYSNPDIGICLDKLRGYPEQQVARAALARARDDDPDMRLVAAWALERTLENDVPSADAREAIRLLAVDADTAVVRASLKSFGALTHWGPYQPHHIAPVAHCETHPDPDVRKAYAEIFARPGSTTGVKILVRMANDPSDGVRLSAAQNLIAMIVDGSPDRADIADALAGLVADQSGFVRATAISGLTQLDDPRTTAAVIAELNRDVNIRMMAHLSFIMRDIIARPDRRYLPGLARWKSSYPIVIIEEAIKACTIRRWFPFR